ncbi:MAG: phenol hydroxylase [Alphaproteobacteria bacterium]|nr:MAG: phenol hydroxylase [Alphaproteobacteria bacterium]
MTAEQTPSTGDQFGDRERVARITGVRRATYVEFDFTVGDEQLTVELIMPYPAFREFCEHNRIRLLPSSSEVERQMQQLKWRFGDRKELGG